MLQKKPQPLPRPERRPDGRIVYVVGFTGSGKTTWTRQQVRGARRLLIWDGKEEWGERDRCRVVTSAVELRAAVMNPKAGRISYRVPVSRETFDVFCRLAWVWIRYGVGTLVIEELADVTTAGKAPVAWGEIVRKSRGYGAEVYALTQRPQEVDKTVQGNASLYHCGMMADAVDAAYVARRLLNCDPALVAAMPPMHWIERDVRTRELRQGITAHKLRK